MSSTDQVAPSEYQWGFSQPERYVFKSRKGLDHEIVGQIAQMKGEPPWLRAFRHRSLDLFLKRPMPNWGGDLSAIDFQNIYYYIKPVQQAGRSWDDVPAEIKDTFDRLGVPEAERKYLAGVGNQYECLSGDARVYTARGFVPIREIEPGDIVFSFDEEVNRIIPSKVRATAEKGEREVFEVRVGNRVIKATANHPFLALTYRRSEDHLRGRYSREWKYLSDLSAGDLVAVVKDLPETGADYRLQQPVIKTVVTGSNQIDGLEYDLNISGRYNDVTLPETTSDDLMWWLGLYIGDGCIRHFADADKAAVDFAIPDSDTEVQAELIRVTESLFGITPRRSDGYRLTINSTIIARFVEANGFDGKALTKRVPDWVFSLPLSQKLAFLGGYLDSGSYVRDHPKNHDVALTSGNRDLLQDMAELLSLCGLPTSEIHRFESKHPLEPDRMVTGYRMSVSGDYQRIASRSPRRLELMDQRKFHHDHSSAKGTVSRKHVTEFHGFVKIDAITSAGVEIVYDIEVEGPHNFVAEGLIVHNSEMVYHKVREDLERQGVIFVDPDTAFREHEDLFRPYFATVIPPNDNKFASLNSAVFSGGSFIYIPKGVHVDLPLQAYFRINAQNMGQFERTLIIADEDSYVHYVEGCFLAGARVRTRDGEKLIEKIQEGDEVFTHQGRYRRVYHTMQRPYSGPIYHIALANDRTLHVTEEHPLLVKRDGDGSTPQWMPAMSVTRADHLVVPAAVASEVRESALALAGAESRQSAPSFIPDEQFLYVPIKSIEIEEMETIVYNFSVEEDESYVAEGVISHNCTAPTYASDSLHSAVVEIIVKRGARVRYTTIQNWSKNVYNLVTKRAQAFADATMEWVDGNLGCVKQGTIVTTPEGVKPIESLEVGDKVLSYDESAGELTFRAVTAKRFSGYQPVHTVTAGERTLQVTANHPFYTYLEAPDQPERYRLGYVRADHLRKAIVPSATSMSERGSGAAMLTKHQVAGTTMTLPETVEIVDVDVSEPSAEPVPTWDIEVEGTGNFIAQGFIVHNSKLTMKYPAVWLMEPGARGEVLSVAFAADGQHQDAGGKMVHVAPHTSSTIVSKSISKGTGRSSYRGLLKVQKGAHHVKSNVRCDALLLDETSRTDTYPYIEIEEEDVEVGHEASVSKVGEEQLFYLMSRGLSESEAYTMIVNGFIEPIAKELPLEYAVELNRLIQLEMSGSVG
jgi:Fe-S cluster assembly scaffold protein SufB